MMLLKLKINFPFCNYVFDRCSFGAEIMSGGVLDSLSLQIDKATKLFTA